MRNKPDIYEIDIDNLYNNLMVYEDELKRSLGFNSASQNLALLSSENTNSTNEVSTANGDFGVSTVGGMNQVPTTPSAHDIAYSFLAQPTTSPQLENEDFQQMDGDDLEELDLRWQVAMLTIRVKKCSDYNFTEPGLLLENVASGRFQGRKTLEPVNYALMAISSSNSSSSSDSEMSTHDKNGLGFGTQMDDLSNKSKTDSENSLTIFDGNPLTPRADISFAGLDEDEVIIEDWTSDDEDDVCADKTVSSVKPNVTQAVRSASLDRKSTTGGCQFLSRRLISWQCKKQTIVANSTTKAEYVAAAHCCGQRLIDVLKIHTDSNVANLLTKGFNVTRYALTHNLTIYDSLVKQFWQTATVRTLANGTQQLVASIDSKEYTISEAFVKSKLQLADATGIHNLSDAEIYAGLATLGYLVPTLTKKLFAKMKRGYAGDIVPLLPAMLAGAAVDQGEGLAQPAEPHHTPIDPIPSTSQPPHLSPQPQSPPHLSPPRSYKAPLPEGNTSGSAEDSMQLKELIVLVPTLVTRINSLEKELKDTKQTLGNAVLKLVKKVKSLETALKRKSKKVLISESEDEESEDQGRKIQDIDDDDPLVSLGVSKEKSTNKGKRYRRKAREEINTGREEINTGIEEVSTGGTKRGQREGKALMIEEDIQATHKTKEQMRQEEAGLEEAIKLQAQLDEEVVKQIHLDKMIAKRMAEEEALTEQQKKRKAQVQFEALFYTEEDWDTIRAKLEANAELSKDVSGLDLPEQDFAKRMVDMVKSRNNHFAEERA
ncbi:hypothetical protein Tco_0173984 [Tanacetum coccineum]